jgi:hypothetical protein
VLLNGFTSGGIAGLVIQGIYAVVAAFEAARIAMKLRDGTAVGKFEFF